MHELATWIDTASSSELRERAPALRVILDKMVEQANQRLPPRTDWRKIAVEHWERCAKDEFSFSAGIPMVWLAERFDIGALGGPPDLPYHARVGIGAHAGRAAVEEDFLLRDAYFLLIKCDRALAHLETFRGREDTADNYAQASIANQNVATYARTALSGFYAFVECFVNSVGEDFVLRTPGLAPPSIEFLRGKKDNRFISIERKIECFPGLIRGDGRRPITLSDPGQITEPYRTFITHVKDVRDASAHYAKSKKDILMSPQLWNKKAHEAATVCIAVARGFWKACYPERLGPIYLGDLDESKLQESTERRNLESS